MGVHSACLSMKNAASRQNWCELQHSVNIDTSNEHCATEIPCLGSQSGGEVENCMSSHTIVENHFTLPASFCLSHAEENGTFQEIYTVFFVSGLLIGGVTSFSPANSNWLQDDGDNAVSFSEVARKLWTFRSQSPLIVSCQSNTLRKRLPPSTRTPTELSKWKRNQPVPFVTASEPAEA